MSSNLRLCPLCNEGYMRPISEKAEESGKSRKLTKFYECDNEYCKYRSAEIGISRNAGIGEESNEPIMCSKCNISFNTESEYKLHYDEKHKSL